MWFKKKAYIIGYNSNTAVDGTDWRTSGNSDNWTSVSQTLPSAADAGKYFYLPALGYYFSGQLRNVGDHGFYWSSSALPGSSNYAYNLYFYSGYVSVGSYGRRDYGHRVSGFE